MLFRSSLTSCSFLIFFNSPQFCCTLSSSFTLFSSTFSPWILPCFIQKSFMVVWLFVFYWEFEMDSHVSLPSAFSSLLSAHSENITVGTNLTFQWDISFSFGYLPLHHKQYKTKSFTFNYYENSSSLIQPLGSLRICLFFDCVFVPFGSVCFLIHCHRVMAIYHTYVTMLFISS